MYVCRLVGALIAMVLLWIPGVLAQPPDTLWTRTWNLPDNGESRTVRQTSDGGYILTVMTARWLENDSVVQHLYLIKTGGRGDSLWSQAFDAHILISCRAILELTDGGFLLAGQARSVKADYRCGALVRTDAQGRIVWSRTYGVGGYYDFAALQRAKDGGLTLAGTATLPGGLNDMGWNPDFWLVKTDSAGYPEWERRFGGAYTASAKR
jgi:hypothetical protein